MCPPPCGPRRSRRESVDKSFIKKSEVENLINSRNFSCLYKKNRSTGADSIEADPAQLLEFLHKNDTTVRIIDGRSSVYKYGYRTICMTSPSVRHSFFIQQSLGYGI